MISKDKSDRVSKNLCRKFTATVGHGLNYVFAFRFSCRIIENDQL